MNCGKLNIVMELVLIDDIWVEEIRVILGLK